MGLMSLESTIESSISTLQLQVAVWSMGSFPRTLLIVVNTIYKTCEKYYITKNQFCIIFFFTANTRDVICAAKIIKYATSNI